MALPVTISGISTAVACVGPYKSSGGNFYFFGRDGTTATTLQAYKATDPTSSFSSIATKTGFGTAVASDAGYQITDVIHHSIGDGAAGSQNVKYQTFDMSSDSFVTAETIASGLSTAGQTGSAQYGCSIVVRSNGNAVAFFNGAQTKKSGTNRARVYWSERTGVNTWSAAVEVDDGGSLDAINPEAVLGASDRVHLFWFYSGSGTRWRSLSSANVLDTAGTGPAGITSSPGAISYDNSGTIKVIGGGGAGNSVFAEYFDSGANPTLNSSTIDSTSVAAVSPVRLFNDGTDAYALYIDASNDLTTAKSTDNGANWGTYAVAMTATVTAAEANLSIDGNIYQRGNSFVIPYVVNDNGTLKYNEYVVRTSTTAWAGSAAPSITLAMTATATLNMLASSSLPVSFNLVANAEIKPLRATALLAIQTDLIANAVRYSPISAAPSLITSLAANALRFTPTTSLLAMSTDLTAATKQLMAAKSNQSVIFNMAASALRFTTALAAPQVSFDLSATTIQRLAGLATLPVELSVIAAPVQRMVASAVLPISFDLLADATIQGQAGQLIQMTAALAMALDLAANAVRYTPTTALLSASTELFANAVRYSPISATPSIVVNLSAQTVQSMAASAAPSIVMSLTATAKLVEAAQSTQPSIFNILANAVRYTPTTAVLAANFNMLANPLQRLSALATLPAVFNLTATPVQSMRAQSTQPIIFGMSALATIAGQTVAWAGSAALSIVFSLDASAKLIAQAQAQLPARFDLSASTTMLVRAQSSMAVETAMMVDAKARLAAYAGIMAELSMDARVIQIGSISNIAPAQFDLQAIPSMRMLLDANQEIDFNLFANGIINLIAVTPSNLRVVSADITARALSMSVGDRFINADVSGRSVDADITERDTNI